MHGGIYDDVVHRLWLLCVILWICKQMVEKRLMRSGIAIPAHHSVRCPRFDFQSSISAMHRHEIRKLVAAYAKRSPEVPLPRVYK